MSHVLRLTRARRGPRDAHGRCALRRTAADRAAACHPTHASIRPESEVPLGPTKRAQGSARNERRCRCRHAGRPSRRPSPVPCNPSTCGCKTPHRGVAAPTQTTIRMDWLEANPCGCATSEHRSFERGGIQPLPRRAVAREQHQLAALRPLLPAPPHRTTATGKAMRSDCNEGERKGAEREGASVGVKGKAHHPRTHVPLSL